MWSLEPSTIRFLFNFKTSRMIDEGADITKSQSINGFTKYWSILGQPENLDKFLKFVDQTSHYVDEEGVHATIYNGVDISKLQAILTGGSTINLQTMQNSINSLNNIVTSQTTDLTTIDNYLKFVDQTLLYVDEQGNPAVMYPGINN